MELLITTYLFIIGAACGSFALVLVDRIHSKRDWIRGRSACESCKKTLSAIDLIPLLSWLIQRGKCRYCNVKLSVAYPLTELFSGALFAASYLFLPYELDVAATIIQFIVWLLALILMVALFVYDLRWKLLPTKLIIPAGLLGIIHAGAGAVVYEGTLIRYALSVFASLLVGAGVFWLLHQVSQGKWIGDGDVRFGVVIGLFLADPFLTWAAIFISSLYGLLYAFLTVPKKRKSLSMQIPFGPFLILGLVTAYLFGSRLIEWYLDTLIVV